MSAHLPLEQPSARRCLPLAQPGLAARLLAWREEQTLRKALHLADEPGLVLDLPSGNGRFWPLLAEKPSRIIVAADPSAEALREASALQHPAISRRVQPLHTTLLDIDLPDNCVDCIFSLDLISEIRDSMLRMELLQEFHRVSRETAIVALRTDGNLAALSRRWMHEQDQQAPLPLPGSRVEREFVAAGFSIQQRLQPLAFLSSRCIYVLRKL